MKIYEGGGNVLMFGVGEGYLVEDGDGVVLSFGGCL